MDLLQLSYFRTVARLEHISKAAEELHVAQPSLSMTIKKLEKELGVPLFGRQGRNIVLNDYGRAVLRHANRIERLQTRLQESLEENNHFAENGFHLAVANSAYLTSWLKDFMAAHPQARVCQQLLDENRIIESLLHNEIDLGLCQYDGKLSQIAHEVIVEDEYLLLLLYTHPLAQKAFLTFADIQNEPIISLPNTDKFTNIAYKLYAQKNALPNIIFEGDLRIMAVLAAAGKGLLFSSRQITYMTKADVTDKVKGYPIQDLNCSYRLSLCWNRKRKLPPMAEVFKQSFLETYPRYLADPKWSENPIPF